MSSARDQLGHMLPNGNKDAEGGPPALAGFVRERRRANHMTQSGLALLAGVGRRFVSDLENAKPSLNLGKVDQVLAVFGRRLGIVERERDEPGTGPGGRVYTRRDDGAAMQVHEEPPEAGDDGPAR